MAGETVNIGAMAERLSDELFAVFGWQQVGPTNVNWECVNDSHSQKTHPTDCTFFYDSPHREERIYLQTDLKSYAKASINSGTLTTALKALEAATHCANTNPNWDSNYLHRPMPYQVDGLLFIYNHDGDYDTEFTKQLDKLEDDAFAVQPGHRLHILSPQRIAYLTTVAHDIVRLRGQGHLPAATACGYFYPNKNHTVPRSNCHPAATIESLLGPTLILQHEAPPNGEPGWILYYEGPGNSSEEFRYLVSTCLAYDLVQPDHQLRIRLPNADPKATTCFQRAIDDLNDELPQAVSSRFSGMKAQSVTNVVKRFFEEEIGMGLRA